MFRILVTYKSRFDPPIRSAIATKRIERGYLRQIKGRILPRPCKHSIQIGINQHVLDPIGASVNHSCNPTARIIKRTVNFYFEILRPMIPGDELTFDYFKNETLPLYEGFVCDTCKIYVDRGCGKDLPMRLHIKPQFVLK